MSQFFNISVGENEGKLVFVVSTALNPGGASKISDVSEILLAAMNEALDELEKTNEAFSIMVFDGAEKPLKSSGRKPKSNKS